MTFGMLRVGVTWIDWHPEPPVLPLPPVPPVPVLGTQRPRELQVEFSPQPSAGSGVHNATHDPLEQKLASHCESEVQAF